MTMSEVVRRSRREQAQSSLSSTAGEMASTVVRITAGIAAVFIGSALEPQCKQEGGAAALGSAGSSVLYLVTTP